MFIGMDATNERSLVQKHEAIIHSVNNTSINLELDINGNLLECNENFVNIFHLSQKDIKSMVIFDMISPMEIDSFNKKWDAIIHGSGFTGIIRARNSSGEEIWLNGSFGVTENTAHETDHIVFIGVNITREKQLETDLHNAMDILKRQERQIRDAEKETSNKLRETKTELLNQFKETERIKNLNEKMLEDISDAVVMIGQDNRISFFNKAAETMWQLNRNDVIEQEVGILFPETLLEKDELLGSFARPGDNKITGKRRKSVIIDKKGVEKQVFVLLSKAKTESETAYMALIQPA
jgi:PAS domain S-box-containing protein